MSYMCKVDTKNANKWPEKTVCAMLWTASEEVWLWRGQYMDRIVTVDETWISLYTPETKVQSTIWKTPGSPSPKKFQTNQSTKKQIFVVFFDAKGVILAHAVPQGTDSGCHILYDGKLNNLKYFSYHIHTFVFA